MVHWICACPSTGSISSPFYLSFLAEECVYREEKRRRGETGARIGSKKAKVKMTRGAEIEGEGFWRDGLRVRKRQVRYEQPLGI